MESATESRSAVCTTCGNPQDPHEELCFACLMQSATEISAGDSFELFDEDIGLPRIGNYELLEEIGRGGMGVIYKARHIYTGQLVALKVLQGQISHHPELVARFRREAQAASRLEHEHVLRVYEVSEEKDGLFFYTMKLAIGGSLAELRQQLRGEPRKVAAIMAKVARGAHHAHENGILHRDLKPANILFDEHGEPKVSDFGLAAWLHQESSLTYANNVPGTPGYLPPEYLLGRPDVLRPTSDVYSLGVILFELLSGRLPFPQDSNLGNLRRAAETPAPLLRTFAPTLSRDLEVICARSLEADPTLRYASSAALAEDLQRWLDHRPILAQPVSPVVRGWKLARRHPAVSVAALLCAALIAVGLVLNQVRQKTAADLVRATAYDRTLAVIPIEDLDALEYTTPLAQEATRACLGRSRNVHSVLPVEVSTPIDPLPRHSDLIRLSRKLGARFFLTGTVRQQGDVIRFVVHLTDAVTDTKLKTEVIEAASPEQLSTTPVLGKLIEMIAKPGTEGAGIERDPAKSSATSLASSYIQAGARHLDRGNPADIEMAIQAFGRAVQEDPENAEALGSLARAMALRSQLGDRELWLPRALATAQQAMKVAPNWADAHRALSFVYYVSGDVLLSQQQALESFELKPDDCSAACSVAEGMANLGALDQALRWNQKAIARQTFASDFCIQRADFLTALACFDRARTVYQEFADFRPELPDGPMGLAHLEALRGNTKAALQDVRRLHERFPAQPILTQTMANFEFQFGDSAAAERLFRDHLADDDWGLYGYLGSRGKSALGCLALRRGESSGRQLVQEALALDDAHLARNPRDPSLLIEKASNLALLERFDEAMNCLMSALQGGLWAFHQMQIDPRMEGLRTRNDYQQLAQATGKRLQSFRKKLNLENNPQD